MGRSIKDTIKQAKETIYVTGASNKSDIAVRGVSIMANLCTYPLRRSRKPHMTSSMGQVATALADQLLNQSTGWDLRITLYCKCPYSEGDYECDIEVATIANGCLKEAIDAIAEEVNGMIAAAETDVIGYCWAATPYTCPLFREAECDDAMHKLFVDHEGLLDSRDPITAFSTPDSRPALAGSIYQIYSDE